MNTHPQLTMTLIVVEPAMFLNYCVEVLPMSKTAIVRRLVALSLLVLFSAVAGTAKASEIRVMISGGLATPYKELVPQFERATDLAR